MPLKPFLHALACREDLDENQTRDAFDLIFEGRATPAQIGAFLMGLKLKGETVPEILGAVRALRARAHMVDSPDGTIDVCGTGGDGQNTFNISTAVAFVVAACGVPVAKHGNRAVSSRTGSSDVLTALGLKIDDTPNFGERGLRELNLGFFYAPTHHPILKQVAGVRQELGMRTIFNLLGPLANPARAKRQLIGVYARDWLQPMAEALRGLGSTQAWLVHGRDGLDEITTTALTDVVQLKDGHITAFTVNPAEYGLPYARPTDLRGGDLEDNAKALRAVLAGHKGAYRDIVALNAAAALVVAGRAADLRQGLAMATQAIDSGEAAQILDHMKGLA